MRTGITRLRFFLALVGEAWQESGGTGLRCELHPDCVFGHGGCGGAGVSREQAVKEALQQARMERQRARDLETLWAETVVFYRAAVDRLEAAGVSPDSDPAL